MDFVTNRVSRDQFASWIPHVIRDETPEMLVDHPTNSVSHDPLRTKLNLVQNGCRQTNQDSVLRFLMFVSMECFHAILPLIVMHWHLLALCLSLLICICSIKGLM